MEGWRSGRSFLVRLARDSRKWNLAALVASQNPKDILGLDVQNLVSTVMVGRIAEDAEIASEALRLLRVPTEVGYEAVLAGLSEAEGGSSSRRRPARDAQHHPWCRTLEGWMTCVVSPPGCSAPWSSPLARCSPHRPWRPLLSRPPRRVTRSAR
jgi:hypothetical protein